MKVHTDSKTHIVSNTLKNILEELPQNNFIQIHKSYIISLNRIEFLEGNQVKIEDKFIPIGLTFKDRLLEKLEIDRSK